MTKTVLITGCSSGFGKLAAKKFQQEGWNVIATMRTPEKETELITLNNVLVTQLDVTDKNSIKSSIEEGILKFGSIDVLVNNAAYGGHSLFEEFTDKAIRAMYNTNVFGLMNVTREVLPIMRKQKGGTILNITSIAGLLGSPTTSVYCSSKYAVEGLSEALALELKPLNIVVKSLAPGGFGTNFIANCDSPKTDDPELKSYSQKLDAHIDGLRQNMKQAGGKISDPQDVADAMFKCATESTPIHNVVGADAEMLIGMRSSMPQQEFLQKLEEMLLPKF